MNRRILFNSLCDFDVTKTKDSAEWIEKIIIKEGKVLGEINYIFCSDEFLLEKNQRFLNHDSYTDVITFNYCTKKTISGDVFISIDRVYENSANFNCVFQDELERVMIHGVLHLIGYDDKTKEEKKEMRKKEDFYLSLRP